MRAARPGRTVAAVMEPSWLFLDDRLRHGPSKDLLASRRWDAVVLQAQKYSSSGNFTYTTWEAAEWARLVRARGAVPVLFPSGPGATSTRRTRSRIHLSIASQAAACLPPIPHSWDFAFTSDPGLVLHAPDGNHSAPAGALLAAMVIASTLTGDSPAGLPSLPVTGVDEGTQAKLRAAAVRAIAAVVPPRQHCPGDPFLP